MTVRGRSEWTLGVLGTGVVHLFLPPEVSHTLPHLPVFQLCNDRGMGAGRPGGLHPQPFSSKSSYTYLRDS